MNTFVQRFSTTVPTSALSKARSFVGEGEDFSDAAWGSEAGFGSLAKGLPSFVLPNVSNVDTFIIIIEPRVADASACPAAVCVSKRAV